MSVRIIQNGTVRHTTNDVDRAVRFARHYGGTVERALFGQWVPVNLYA